MNNPIIAGCVKISPDVERLNYAVRELISQWFDSQCKYGYTEFFLYHKSGELQVRSDGGDGLELSMSTPFSLDWSQSMAYQVIRPIVGRLPILPKSGNYSQNTKVIQRLSRSYVK